MLGALGLFGTKVGELNGADLLVGHSLAHVASVALVQYDPPVPSAVLPHLRSALAGKVMVEQAKGLLRERLDVSIAQASILLRQYARSSGTHLTELARQLMSEPGSRPALLAELTRWARTAGIARDSG